MQLKRCSRCKQEKSLDQFCLNPTSMNTFGRHAYCNACFKVYRKEYKLRTLVKKPRRTSEFCLHCLTPLTKNYGNYCSVKCQQDAYHKTRQQDLKRRAVSFAGGKCIQCGYDKCIAALTFHHSVGIKNFYVSSVYRSWDKIVKEIALCQLLCANCHFELHGPNDNKKYSEKPDAIYLRQYCQRMKQRALTYKGGSCQKCGYAKSTRALEFHHRIPEEKKFNIHSCRLSWKKLKPELDKTVLLCSNCHRELEHSRDTI